MAVECIGLARDTRYSGRSQTAGGSPTLTVLASLNTNIALSFARPELAAGLEPMT
jgi:hypothetical protein